MPQMTTAAKTYMTIITEDSSTELHNFRSKIDGTECVGAGDSNESAIGNLAHKFPEKFENVKKALPKGLNYFEQLTDEELGEIILESGATRFNITVLTHD